MSYDIISYHILSFLLAPTLLLQLRAWVDALPVTLPKDPKLNTRREAWAARRAGTRTQSQSVWQCSKTNPRHGPPAPDANPPARSAQPRTRDTGSPPQSSTESVRTWPQMADCHQT